MFRSKIFLGGLVAVTSMSAFMLTSSTTSAAPEEKSARIEVRNACSMESEVSNAHTATVSAGSYKDNIGTTVVSVVCNDNAGFAVYAIGFTNDTDGTTTMNGLQGGTIATGLAKQGNTSSWSMKLSTYDNDAYAPTIENDYDDYNVVPDDYTMVASYPAAATSTNPSSFKTSYAAYVSIGQAVDTYTGQVKYVLVHPSNGEAPEKDDDDDDGEDPLDPDPDITKSTDHPCMKVGGATCEDTDDDGIGDTMVFPGNSLLRAFEIAYTNASKPMYIEDANTAIGWRPMVASDYATVGGKEVRFAIQDIKMTLDGEANGTKVCAAAANSSRTNSYVDEAIVMDLRDGKSYWIAKLEDGKCWMTQNLDLNLVHAANDADALYTHDNTDLGWTVFDTTAKWNPSASTISLSSLSNVSNWTLSATAPVSGDVGDKYVPSSEVAYTDDTTQSSLNDCITNTSAHSKDYCDHYHIGNYYNYAAAAANNNIGTSTYGQKHTQVANSICPAGWRLPVSVPTGYGVNNNTNFSHTAFEFGYLLDVYDIASDGYGVGGDSFYDDYDVASLPLRSSPLFVNRIGIIYTYQGRAGISSVGNTGYFWSGTLAGDTNETGTQLDENTAYAVMFEDEYYVGITYTNQRTFDEGAAIRCIAR